MCIRTIPPLQMISSTAWFKISGSHLVSTLPETLHMAGTLCKMWYPVKSAPSTPTPCCFTMTMMETPQSATKVTARARCTWSGCIEFWRIHDQLDAEFTSCKVSQWIVVGWFFEHWPVLYTRAHIPPHTKKDKSYYSDTCLEGYFQLLADYKETIAAHFAGHYNRKLQVSL